jgi:ATP-dependent exoDNAse (exonuclease V) beta subunit
MLVDAPKQNSNGEDSKAALKTLAGIVRCALVDPSAKRSKVLFSTGDSKWHAKIQQTHAETHAKEQFSSPIALAQASQSHVLRGWASQAASKLEHDCSLRQALRLSHGDARLRGVVIHALFQQVRWIEDFDVDDAALHALVQGVVPRQPRAWAVSQVADFRQMISRTDIRTALACGKRDRSRFEVKCEFPFARLIDGRVQRGSIDRIVTERRGSRITSASILDFKTDQVSLADAPLLADRYRLQLRAYRQAAAEAMSIDEKCISIALLFVEPGIVVNL